MSLYTAMMAGHGYVGYTWPSFTVLQVCNTCKQVLSKIGAPRAPRGLDGHVEHVLQGTGQSSHCVLYTSLSLIANTCSRA